MILRHGIYAQPSTSNLVIQAINFNSLTTSDNDKINLGSTILNNIRTISFWWKPNSDISGSSTVYPIITRDGVNTANNELYIFMASNAKISVFTRAPGYAGVNSDSDTWLSSTWYHISFVMDSITGMRLIIDGVDQLVTNPRTVDSGFMSGINTNISGFAQYLTTNGSFKIKNLQIWNTARTTPEIIVDKDTYYPSGTTDLKETWHFKNETGFTVTGENGNTGTISTNNAGGVTYVNSTMREII